MERHRMAVPDAPNALGTTTTHRAGAGTAPAAPKLLRPDGDTYVVILAGGEGRRLRDAVRARDGSSVPKQFCRFRDDRTLLATTLERAFRIAPAERVLVVVRESHRRWWTGDLALLPRENVIAQRDDRGTAIALLQALVEAHCRDRDPEIVLMPSDTDVEDEGVLLSAIAAGQRIARVHGAQAAVLGVRPTHVDTEFGLLLPGEDDASGSRSVRAFVEKPARALARRWTRSGALWNTFMLACPGWTLYELFEDALPGVPSAYLRALAFGRGEDTRHAAVAALPAHDLVRDVLERRPERLRLVPVPDCGWTDLGTPARLRRWLARHRECAFLRERMPGWRTGDDIGGVALPA